MLFSLLTFNFLERDFTFYSWVYVNEFDNFLYFSNFELLIAAFLWRLMNWLNIWYKFEDLFFLFLFKVFLFKNLYVTN